ncbi:3528_t:CDS:1, partial [Gigaspora rosea]
NWPATEKSAYIAKETSNSRKQIRTDEARIENSNFTTTNDSFGELKRQA